MLKEYKIYYVRFSDDTFIHIAAVNMEHALFTAASWLDNQHVDDEDYDIDVVYICLDTQISSLIIFKS